MDQIITIDEEIKQKFGDKIIYQQETKDEFPTIWVGRNSLVTVLNYLKNEITNPFRMLYDITAIDERSYSNRNGLPQSDFTIVYHLLSFDRNNDIRIKVPLKDNDVNVPTITDLWQNANWYEREAFDMFGINFNGHKYLRRLLMPLTWNGHPLRKDHPARATEMGPFQLPDDKQIREQDALHFNPDEWGMQKHSDDSDFMFLNLGPQHPGTHGVLRLVLQLDGEDIVDIVPDIGFHHRGAEKMAERQSWHTFIPYTDRVDYLGGVMNNLAYCLGVEKLAGIEVPDRGKVIRVMLCELFRIASHLVWYGTFAQDVGQLSPVFYMFTDREKVFDIIAAVCGDRMHPNWFRIGGVQDDLPNGWDKLVREFVNYFPKRLNEYDKLVMKNKIFKARTKGIGSYTKEEAVEWGITGPGLRACGFEWDFRKKRPYSAYDQFEFDIPIAHNGDCYDRASVRVEEMRQSLKIIEQCLNNMPEGEYKSHHPQATPPVKERTMHDIETLITHFLNVTWGPVIPPGEAFSGIEATKGNNGYYLISDGNTSPYRVRIRTPSFPHMQMVPYISRGHTIADLLAILGSVDFVLADLDR
ncbi:MAG: NADH-quinone oxidoreductase subunit C/D [Ignavibacteriota bacterium]|nr:NADH-quinone oxidoreductase subunit C/D [Ignavibacteriales bacterium]MBL1122181.1 NADH-quinone oxidoreductase subunit C/D [Ignavibacteriota bacterium]MCE7856980.1 NADH-quinone oxidoreductase subunit C/D [Ignavibacteria bacterium CHB3]MEB2296371.1 NADH-quinone oxidoreductase subunit C/D [Ignavibacteria bacterium]GJQ40540.1 MAG: NADH-quinone oxidoreductase subunit C/D [Ignavibacteriaceae bacterium]